ncbi:hypothetical protein [Staphylococcus xylosus]|uniref:hypothetical protein n=1 Tax=Staphylococcus xylosus TaxID=1288 RepID=UPI001CDBC671|nr:hypothetical protein [Staphylococcus xylosus]MCA2504003.1 hypothetical protein [Staphylococcus xylosus]MCQ3820672.1 hypothetical protein [Staphylococcus xylosus]
MTKENLLFFNTIKTFEKKNVVMISFILIVIMNIIIGSINLNFSNNSNLTFIIISSLFSSIFTILFYFLIIYIFSKLAKGLVNNKNLFKATTIMVCILTTFNLIASIIQFLFQLDTNKINLLSLNVLDPNIAELEPINLILFLSSYLIFLILHTLCDVKKVYAIISSVIFLILRLAIDIGAVQLAKSLESLV